MGIDCLGPDNISLLTREFLFSTKETIQTEYIQSDRLTLRMNYKTDQITSF